MKTHAITEDEIHVILNSTKTILNSLGALRPIPDKHRQFCNQAIKSIYATLDTVTDKELVT